MGKFSSYGQDTAPTTDDYVLTVDPTTGLNKRVTLDDIIELVYASGTSVQVMQFLASASGLGVNALLNGAMNVWQRAATFTPLDDVYGPDRWNLLVEANSAWTFARDTDVPSTGGSQYSLKATNVTLNNQCAIVQFLEAKDAYRLIGKTVSLSFQAKTNGTEIANLRAAILSWTGTADAVTSDVIGTWASDGTDPTFAANWTKENTPSNLALTSSWQRFYVENVNIDTASTKNIAVVIWVDDGTIAANDDFYLTQVQLNVGEEALPFQFRSFAEELANCRRYYRHSYPYGTNPGTADGYTEASAAGIAIGANDTKAFALFDSPMFKSPTLTIYAADAASGSGTAARIRDSNVGGLETITSVDPAVNLAAGFGHIVTNTGTTAGRGYTFNYVADAEM